MINTEFADNSQLRLNETDELPVCINNHGLYFMLIDQDTLNIASYNSDVRSLNNFHKALSLVEEHERVLILCNWMGRYQAHTFVCDKDILRDKVRAALGEHFLDELESNLSY